MRATRFREEIIIILSFSIDVDASITHTHSTHLYTYIYSPFGVLAAVNRRTISADVPWIKNVCALYNTSDENTLSSLDPRNNRLFFDTSPVTTDSLGGRYTRRSCGFSCCCSSLTYVCIRVNVCTYIMYIVYFRKIYPPNRWITNGGQRVFTRASMGDKRLVVGRVKNDNIVFFSEQIWTRRPPAAVYAEWPFLHVVINIILLGIWLRSQIPLNEYIYRVTGHTICSPPVFTSQLFRIWFLEFSDTWRSYVQTREIFVRYTSIIRSDVLWIYTNFCFTGENTIFHCKLFSGQCFWQFWCVKIKTLQRVVFLII